VVGDIVALEKVDDLIKTNASFKVIDKVEQALDDENIYVINLDIVNKPDYEFGKINGHCGMASYKYIEKAIELAMKKEVSAVATAPINKESLKAGNIPFIGHTEMFAALTDTKDPLTMFEVDKLRVFFLSRHVSLKDAIEMVKKDRIIDYVQRCTDALEKMGVKGMMAIAGLNPHSGENGLFGWEEVNEIVPAIQELVKQGYDVAGPVPADSVFYHGLNGKYESVLSLYHDQGHIATKTYDFHRTISITHGMPILRTSVDHGTAFDIAGKDIADPISMIEATLLAAKYSVYFTRNN
jgi:4-hydroxythreonine-4-phosphate dehydrogenase